MCEEGIRLMGQLSTSLYGAPDDSRCKGSEEETEEGSEESWWETLSSMGSSSSKASSIEEKDKPIVMVLGKHINLRARESYL